MDKLLRDLVMLNERLGNFKWPSGKHRCLANVSRDSVARIRILKHTHQARLLFMNQLFSNALLLVVYFWFNLNLTRKLKFILQYFFEIPATIAPRSPSSPCRAVDPQGTHVEWPQQDETFSPQRPHKLDPRGRKTTRNKTCRKKSLSVPREPAKFPAKSGPVFAVDELIYTLFSGHRQYASADFIGVVLNDILNSVKWNLD